MAWGGPLPCQLGLAGGLMVPTPAQFLNSPDASQYVSWKTMYNSLNLGLSSRNQMVRAMSLKGLSSTLMRPKKVRGKEIKR